MSVADVGSAKAHAIALMLQLAFPLVRGCSEGFCALRCTNLIILGCWRLPGSGHATDLVWSLAVMPIKQYAAFVGSGL